MREKIQALAFALNYLITEIKAPSPFTAEKKPEISLENYINRFSEYYWPFSERSNHLEESEFLVIAAFLYIKRLNQKKEIPVNECSIHYLFSTAFVVAAKFFSETRRGNNFMAEISEIELKKFNSLELEFCFGIDFNLAISAEEYNATVRDLNKANEKKQYSLFEIELPSEADVVDSSCLTKENVKNWFHKTKCAIF